MVFINSCGILTIDFIAPPISSDVVSAQQLTFSHNTTNSNDEFIGYNLYYKFYTTDEDECQTDKNAILADPIILNASRLTSRNFLDLVIDDSFSIPELVIAAKDTAQSFRITLGDPLENQNNPQSIATISGTTLDNDLLLYRDQRNPDSAGSASDYYPLNVNATYYNTVHADIYDDISDISTILSEGKLAIAFYGIAFGINEQFQSIYSEVEFLGMLSMYSDPAIVSHSCNS